MQGCCSRNLVPRVDRVVACRHRRVSPPQRIQGACPELLETHAAEQRRVTCSKWGRHMASQRSREWKLISSRRATQGHRCRCRHIGRAPWPRTVAAHRGRSSADSHSFILCRTMTFGARRAGAPTRAGAERSPRPLRREAGDFRREACRRAHSSGRGAESEAFTLDTSVGRRSTAQCFPL